MRTNDERMRDIKQRAEQKNRALARSKSRNRLLIIAAAIAAFVVAVNLILFIPYGSGLQDISPYKNSPYFPLMQQLNELTAKKPKYKNNFQAMVGFFSDIGKKGGIDFPADDSGSGESPSSPGQGGYEEVTDNQEQGVIEGDLFKRTSTHLFYISHQNAYSDSLTLHSYTIAGGESAECGSLEISPEEGSYYSGSPEMFLSDDGRTVTVFTSTYNSQLGGTYTAIIEVDASDPANLKETGRKYVSGRYVTARSAGGDFLVITNFSVRSAPDFSDENQYLPQAGEWGELESLPAGDIYFPDGAAAARYTVICRLDGDGLEIEGATAFLSFSQQAYVSQNNIYVTRGYKTKTEVYGREVYQRRTQVSCVSYAGEGLEIAGSADVAGEVLNQYSLDEYGGSLRIVTTTDMYELRSYDYNSENTYVASDDSASLYVIGLDDFTIRASLENFAPAGEEVTSARFEDEIVWVCTARVIELADPVFRIDLSDLENITYTDTGTIYGYSTSLVDFAYGTLLGIGYGDHMQLKVEIYVQESESVVSLCSYEADVTFSEVYKAYLIDRENGLVGLHVTSYPEGGRYILLHFDGTAINEVQTVAIADDDKYDYDYTRATIAEGWLYVITESGELHAQAVPWLV